MAIAKALAVRYGIAICIYASKKFWRIFNLAVVELDRQTAKFSGYTVISLKEILANIII